MCGCGDNFYSEPEPVGGTVFEIRATVKDSDFEGVQEEAARIREALEDYYWVQGEVEVRVISESDPTSGIRHYAGMEG
jgi:hypothetical protein